jgi:hypothetical protein
MQKIVALPRPTKVANRIQLAVIAVSQCRIGLRLECNQTVPAEKRCPRANIRKEKVSSKPNMILPREIGVVIYAILLCLRKISSKITAEDTLLPSSWEQEDVVILAPQGIGGRVLPDI